MEQNLSTLGSRKYEEIAASKRADAFSKIPKEWRLPREITSQISKTSDFSVLEIPRTCGLLSSKELEITEAYTATALRDKIASGGLSAVAVTEAFCKRAAIAQQLVGSTSLQKIDLRCCTDRCVDKLRHGNHVCSSCRTRQIPRFLLRSRWPNRAIAWSSHQLKGTRIATALPSRSHVT